MEKIPGDQMTGPCLTSRLVIRFYRTIPFVWNQPHVFQLFSSSRSPYHMLLLYIPLVHPPQDKAQIERTQNHETGDDNTPGSKPAAIGTGHIVRLITRMKSTRHQVPGAGAGMNVWFKEKWQRETIQYLNRVSIDGKKMTG